MFDELIKYKGPIESEFGHPLEWDRMNDKISSKVYYKLDGVSIYNYKDWDKALNFIKTNIINLEKAVREPLKEVKKCLNSDDDDE